MSSLVVPEDSKAIEVKLNITMMMIEIIIFLFLMKVYIKRLFDGELEPLKELKELSSISILFGSTSFFAFLLSILYIYVC